MSESSVEHLLLFVILACLVYYLMGSCGCGFSVGGQNLSKSARPSHNQEGIRFCPQRSSSSPQAGEIDWCWTDATWPNCDAYYTQNWDHRTYDAKQYHMCKGWYGLVPRCISSEEPCVLYDPVGDAPPPPPPPPPPQLTPYDGICTCCRTSQDQQTDWSCHNGRKSWYGFDDNTIPNSSYCTKKAVTSETKCMSGDGKDGNKCEWTPPTNKPNEL
jgi:hypothetical protein